MTRRCGSSPTCSPTSTCRRHRPRRPVLHPDADDQILAGDEVHFIVETGAHRRALAAFGFEERLSDRLVIGGGGNVGMFLAREIERRHPELNVKLIEADAARAELVADWRGAPWSSRATSATASSWTRRTSPRPRPWWP